MKSSMQYCCFFIEINVSADKTIIYAIESKIIKNVKNSWI